MTTHSKIKKPRSVLNRSSATPNGTETLADLLHQLGDIPPERVHWQLRPATEKDVVRLLEAERKRICELVDGVLVEKPMSTWESILAFALAFDMGGFVRKHKLGKILSSDGLVKLLPGVIRSADVAYVSRERLKGHKPFKENIAAIIPDLAVEILSPSNTRGEMKRKVKEYFAGGVRLVWIIHPRKRTAEVYTDLDRCQRVGKDGMLDGGDVLPGYQLSLKKLFAELND